MRHVACKDIVEAVKDLCLRAAFDLPADVLASLTQAAMREKSPAAGFILETCCENAKIASAHRVPICQDTGVAVLFVEVGASVFVAGGLLEDGLQEGVRRGFREGLLRASIVDDPVYRRKNTADNTPAVVHTSIVSGEAIRITLMLKGGGCENMGAIAMLKPSDGEEGIAEFVVRTIASAGGNPCPPVIVGVGVGGTLEKAALLAKRSLLRPVGASHPDPDYARLETTILNRINETGIGPQGLGGSTTALAVHIETYPCHIASLPVAVNLDCHAARHATAILE